MGILLLAVLVLQEGFFAVWAVITKRDKGDERSILKVAILLLLTNLFLLGLLEWRLLYVAPVLVLTIQSIAGIIKLIRKNNSEFRIKRVIWVLIRNCLVWGLTTILIIIFPEYKEISTTGEYNVVTEKYTWIDENRIEEFTDTNENRAVTIQFWYPDDANSTYPLVVFSHGAFGHIDSNYSTYIELASNGYVVASIGHTYHALYNIDTEDRLTIYNRDFVSSVYEVNNMTDEKYASIVYNITRDWMELRVDDENFVLDAILDKVKINNNLPFSIIDSNKIGLIGHSLGGASSAQLGRQRNDIDCVINLDGTMLGEWTDVKDGIIVYNEIPYPVPILNVYSENLYLSAMTEDEDVYVNFYASQNALYPYEIVIKDSGHLNLTDLPLVSPVLANKLGVGTVDARRCIETMNEIVKEFFDCYLKDSEIPKFAKEY